MFATPGTGWPRVRAMFPRARTTPAMSGRETILRPQPLLRVLRLGDCLHLPECAGRCGFRRPAPTARSVVGHSGPYVPSRNIEKLFVETAVVTGAIHQVHFEDPVTYVAGAVFSPH